MSVFTIGLIVIVVIVLYVIIAFNRLISMKNRTSESWSDIEVQMKRRYNLIPNLVETVKGYAKHERETLENVIEARNAAMAEKGDAKAQAKKENMLQSTLRSLFALSENYPDLKANQNFMELQRELTDAEDKIQAARRFYNTNVMKLNTTIEQFPTNVIAGMFNFNKKEFFELEEAAAKKPVAVKF
jgi:LemA protein